MDLNRKIPFFLLRFKSSGKESNRKIRLHLYKSNRNVVRLDLFRLLSDIPTTCTHKQLITYVTIPPEKRQTMKT